jgi:hypothetical protein
MAAQITQIWLAIIEIRSDHPATPNGGSARDFLPGFPVVGRPQL